jgi:hypothetical protein
MSGVWEPRYVFDAARRRRRGGGLQRLRHDHEPSDGVVARLTMPQPQFSSALLTDLYELTMLQAYFEEHMRELAVFSLFVRRLPEQRNYLLA